jgi:hypothetical protein
MTTDLFGLTLRLVIALAIFSLAWWIAISLIYSRMSGWRQLSKDFRASSKPPGEARHAGPFLSGVQMRSTCDYSSVIHLSAADDALYLSVVFAFRAGHPPLCIPWKQIDVDKAERSRKPIVVLQLGANERIPLQLSERIASRLGILERVPDAPPAD